jgi:hypothetical protein
VLRCAFVHVCVGLELKEEVHSVDEEKDNAGTAADFEDVSGGIVALCIGVGGVEGSLRG